MAQKVYEELGQMVKLRDRRQETSSVDELLHHEAEQHDEDYRGKTGFDSPTLSFTKDYVWWYNDHTYKTGRYVRGYRKRRLFQLMNLSDIAGKRVLDVGCGTGQHSVFLAMYGAQCVGVDLSSEGIRIAGRMAKANNVASQCEFQVASVTELPFEDAEFDIILYNAVLHHVMKYPNVKEETWRVLKPGGRVFVAEGLRDNPIYRFARSVKDFFKSAPAELGDVDLEFSDLVDMSDPYESVYFERRCLLEGAKQAMPARLRSSLPGRGILFVLTSIDRLLLWTVKPAEKWCSEVVGCMTKPRRDPDDSTLPKRRRSRELDTVV